MEDPTKKTGDNLEQVESPAVLDSAEREKLEDLLYQIDYLMETGPFGENDPEERPLKSKEEEPWRVRNWNGQNFLNLQYKLSALGLAHLEKDFSVIAAAQGVKQLMEVVQNCSDDEKLSKWEILFHQVASDCKHSFLCNREASCNRKLANFFIETYLAKGWYPAAYSFAYEELRDDVLSQKIDNLSPKDGNGHIIYTRNLFDRERMIKAGQTFLEEIKGDPILEVDEVAIFEKIRGEIQKKLGAV